MELFIFSQDEQLQTVISEDTGLIQTKYRIERNGVPTEPLTFEIKADDPVAAHVKDENKVVFKDHEGDWRLMTIKELDDSDSMEGPITIATCVPTFLAELNDHIVVDRRFVDQTADVALAAAVQGTRWKSKVEVELGKATTNFYYISSTEAIWETINTWGGEFKDVVEFNEETNQITSCYVKIIQRLGRGNGQRFEIDHNTTEIGRTVLSYPKTALYGRGASLPTEDEEGNETGGYTRYIDFADVEWKKSKGDPVDKPLGQEWVGRDEDRLSMGYYDENGNLKHRFGIFSNQDYEDSELLLYATWEATQKANQVEVHYRLSAQLFDEKVNLGDTSQAIDRVFARPIEIQARIIAMEYDLMDIEGTMVVEMGQFLDLGDNRISDLEKEVENIKNRPPKAIIDEGSYPNIKPGTPVNVEAYGGMEVIQLYWDYASQIYVKHYEVYGSQTEDFIPDTQHLLWRGNTSAFAHTVGTDEVWYYRVRAVNYHGTPSDWSVQVRGATNRVLTEDILWGPELAERMRELHKVSDIIGENGVDFDQISEEAKDLINQQARIYTDEEIDLARDGILSDLDDRTDYLNNRIADLNDRADGLVNRADEIDDLLGEHGDRFLNMETDIDDIEGRISASIEEIERIDDTVTSNSLELEAQADLIKGKLDEITYTRDKEGILESIEQNTLEIEATAEGLQLNADAISKVDGVVEGHSAQLSFLNDEISTKVEESFVRDAIGDIEIGDRNYYLNTSDNHLVLNSPNEFGTARISGLTVSDDFLESAKGNQVTISIMAKSSGYEQGSSPWIGIETTYQVDGVTRYLTFQLREVITDHSGEWRRYSSNTISIPSNAETLRKSVTYLIRDIKGHVELKEPTLVIGNKAGSYQLAPEDILSVQENHWTEINQNSRSIEAQAESIINMDGLITDAQASINIMSDEISERVTKTIFDDESDYLRNSIAETRNFAEGIEQTVSSIEIGSVNLASLNNIEPSRPVSTVQDGYRFTLNRDDAGNPGIRINHSVFIEDKDYVLSFKIKKISGDIQRIAGHAFAFTTTKGVYIDGVKIGNEWGNTVNPFPDDTEEHEVVVYLKYTPSDYNGSDSNLYIQPNRPGYGFDYKVEIWDIQVEQGTMKSAWQPSYEDTEQRMTQAESEIVQLSDDMRFKVDVDGIVSEINLNREGIRLSGALIHLNGLSLIDEAIIQNAHIANGTIERAKLGRAIIGTAQVENGAITNAKIANLNADKLNAGSIRGIDVYGAKFRSSNGNNWMEIVGGEIHLHQSNGRYMDLSPTGLYGYNAGGSVRFQADSLLVTSRALGTATNNVYLAAQSGKEARVVDMKDVPSDGEIASYTYLPLRADGFYGNYIENNAGSYGNNLYLRPRSGGEVRVTGAGTTDAYYPLRAGALYSNTLITTTTSMWLGTDNAVHLVNKGYVENSSGNPIYRTLYAGTIRNYGIITHSTHGYFGVDGELRVVNKGLGDIYRDIRGLGFIGNRVALGTHINGIHFHVQPAGNGEVRITSRDGSGSYRPIRATDYLPPSSTRESKKRIDIFNDNTLNTFRNTNVYHFLYNWQDNNEKLRLGVMLDEAPNCIIASTGDTLELYSTVGYLWKGLKDTVNYLDEEINWQRIEYQDLKNKVTKLEEKIKQLEESAA
ncbi:phage tail spike protein [Oceanobacillus sojae]|uniref:phage tail spike protein n=1 Tax=Oceanobacillus sojae TaxID=582851 RepID=UPI0021A6752F|nr:phage tail spike protein [Oceanobacillus sojae]MCT1904125.1 phage tail protein [Oceanobacillus sojae]